MFYQRLNFMIDDKLYCRARGPVKMLTLQPAAGKTKNGGLRFGQMQRDALAAYGAAYCLKDRLYMDMVPQLICNNCRIPVSRAYLQDTITQCRLCKASNYQTISIPYAFKLLAKELSTFHVKTIYHLDDFGDSQRDTRE